MASSFIYLDESGDLGWTFTAPYRSGGSSRYLTISAVCVPAEKTHVPKRVVKDLFRKYKWSPTKEHKWSGMASSARKDFAVAVKQMCEDNPDILLFAIVVKKQNVMLHIRKDGNKLYNYMIKLALLDRMATFDVVTLVPDPRNVKVQSGNSLHDYLQTELWFTKKAITKLVSAPTDSKNCLGLQFADMLSGAVQMRYEDNDATLLQIIGPKILISPLFF